MKKWEYLDVYSDSNFRIIEDETKDLNDTLSEWLNKFGEEGWELINVRPRNDTHNYYTFKRLKQ